MFDRQMIQNMKSDITTFFRQLFGGWEFGYVEIFYQWTKTRRSPQGKPHLMVEWVSLWDWFLTEGYRDKAIKRMVGRNKQGYNVGVGPALRRARMESHEYLGSGEYQPRPEGELFMGREVDLVWMPGLWLDVDEKRLDNLKRLRAFDPPPSIIVQSSPGKYHAYWLFEEPTAITDVGMQRTLKGFQKGLVNAFGTQDSSSISLIQKLGLPGTVHWKYFKASKKLPLRKLIASETDIIPRYDLRRDLDRYRERLHQPTPRAKVHQLKPQGAAKDLPPWVQQAVSSGVPSGQQDRTWFEHACALRDRGWSMNEVEALFRTAPLSGDFTAKTMSKCIQSAFKYPTQARVTYKQHYFQQRRMSSHVVS